MAPLYCIFRHWWCQGPEPRGTGAGGSTPTRAPGAGRAHAGEDGRQNGPVPSGRVPPTIDAVGLARRDDRCGPEVTGEERERQREIAPRARHAAGGRAAPRSRLRRFLVVTTAGAGALVLACAAAGGVFLWTLPGVGNAQSRVAALAATHHAALRPLPPPTKLGDSTVAVEDEHFYSNVFFDVAAGALRAGLATLHRSGDPGGSTIAQQLAKALYPHPPGLGGTMAEIGLGVKLALSYSKPRLLDMYLNVVYFGNGYWGADAAARGYFGTTPGRLSWAQASLLAGLLQAPSAYDPIHHFRLAKARQAHVLAQLVANHYLTAAQARATFDAPLVLR